MLKPSVVYLWPLNHKENKVKGILAYNVGSKQQFLYDFACLFCGMSQDTLNET